MIREAAASVCGSAMPQQQEVAAGAGEEVVDGEAGGLHEGVDDGGSDEAEAPANHVLADGLRLGGFRRDLPAGAVLGEDGPVVDEGPYVPV